MTAWSRQHTATAKLSTELNDNQLTDLEEMQLTRMAIGQMLNVSTFWIGIPTSTSNATIIWWLLLLLLLLLLLVRMKLLLMLVNVLLLHLVMVVMVGQWTRRPDAMRITATADQLRWFRALRSQIEWLLVQVEWRHRYWDIGVIHRRCRHPQKLVSSSTNSSNSSCLFQYFSYNAMS